MNDKIQASEPHVPTVVSAGFMTPAQYNAALAFLLGGCGFIDMTDEQYNDAAQFLVGGSADDDDEE